MKVLKYLKVLLLIIVISTGALFAISCQTPEPEVIYETPSVTLDDYVPPTKEYNTYDGITIDGLVDDAWEDKQKLCLTENVGGVPHEIEISSHFAQEGLVMYFKVLGAPVFYNPVNHPNQNSGVEVYIAPSDAASIKDVGWQVGIDSTGSYLSTRSLKKGGTLGYQYLLFNTYIDIATNIDGELNTYQSNGYFIEMMFPWEHLTGGVIPDSLKIDTAIIFKSEIAGLRNSWYSLSKAVNPAYDFNVPTSWFRFTSDGYFDESAPAPYTINNGLGVQNCTVNVSGNYKTGISVNVIPDAGYSVSSLEINGISYDTLSVTLPIGADYKADIGVVVEPFTGYDYDILVSKGYAYGVKSPAKNTSVTFISTEGVMYPTVVDNSGVINIKLPAGDYVIKAQNFDPVTISLLEDKFDGYQVTLLKKVFNETHGYQAKDDETCLNGASFKFEDVNAKFTSAWEDNIRMTISDVDYSDIVLFNYKMTFKLKDRMYSSIMFKDVNNGWCRKAFFNLGSWFNSTDVSVKTYNGTLLHVFNKSNATETKIVDDTYLTIDLHMVINKNVVELFSVKDGKLISLGSFTENANIAKAYIGTTDNEGSVEYSEFKIYEGDEAKAYLSAPVNVSKNDLVEVSAPTSMCFGQRATVVVTPDVVQDGVVAVNVTVNGKKIELTTNEDGTKTFAIEHLDSSIDSYDIVIDAQTVYPVDTRFAVTGVDIGGNTFTVSNQNVLLEGQLLIDATIDEDGSLEVSLPVGSYLLYVDGYEVTTILVINNVTEYSIKLAKKFFVDNESFTTGYDQEKGYNFTSSVNNKYLDVTGVTIAQPLKISFTYSGTIGAGHRQWVEVVASSSNGNKLSAQFLTWDSNFLIKEPKSRTQTTIYSVAGAYVKDFYILLHDGYFEIYYADGTYLFKIDQSWNTQTALTDVVDLQFYYGCETHSDWSMYNIKIEPYTNA